MEIFRGHRQMHRSEKSPNKVVVKKVEPMDTPTRDQKEYLDPEVFEMMGVIKEKIECGELQDDQYSLMAKEEQVEETEEMIQP